MIYYKEHLTLTNKLRKPVVEKLRRDQIKSSIEHLRSFLGPEILNQQPVSKLEKADILELTGCFLRQQQQYQLVSSSSCSGPVNQGYSTCVKEIVHFLSKDEVKKQSQRRLLSHFQSLQPSSDKNQRESDLSQLSSLAQHSIMCISMITSSEGSELEVVTSYKYLGVWLDSTLSFSQDISKLQVKVKSRLGFLYCNRSCFTPAAKLTLIQMTILPMLDYGDIIYRSAGKGALVRLDVLYHSAIRFATNAPYRTHHSTLYASVN
uniref:BHLH domain-containing protein n=1 Tax=Salmo trutta TaxID=8032 RepID=A0A673W9L0_SALTR